MTDETATTPSAPTGPQGPPPVDIAALVDAARARLNVLLPQEWKTELTRSGGYSIGFENTAVFIDILENTDETIVRISAPVILDAAPTPELCKYVATEFHGYYFGAPCLIADDDNPELVHMYYKHSILGESLDPAELHRVISAVAWLADTKCKEIKDQYGGRTYREDTE